MELWSVPGQTGDTVTPPCGQGCPPLAQMGQLPGPGRAGAAQPRYHRGMEPGQAVLGDAAQARPRHAGLHSKPSTREKHSSCCQGDSSAPGLGDSRPCQCDSHFSSQPSNALGKQKVPPCQEDCLHSHRNTSDVWPFLGAFLNKNTGEWE